jgi:hypothetical protein
MLEINRIWECTQHVIGSPYHFCSQVLKEYVIRELVLCVSIVVELDRY